MLLALVLFLPMIGAALLFTIDKSKDKLIKKAALFITLATFVVSVPLYFQYDADVGPDEIFQLGVEAEWIPSLGVGFKIAIDGVSLLLILLVTFLMPIVVVASVKSIGVRQRDFYALLLLLQSFMIGAFCARDLFLFYLYWELMVIPMYFIIGIWGGKPRIRAAMKFFIYTMFGSLPMLLAVIYLFIKLKAYGDQNPDVDVSYSLDALSQVTLTGREQWVCFVAFGLSFAVKLPMFPFHTWLPDAHTEAPTPGSVVLAGVLLKMGGYGFIRFAIPFFPEAVQDARPVLFVIGAFTIVYAALVALVQTDVKRLVAYSSVSHMGLVLLGIFALNPEGMQGAVYQMLAHGLTTGGLFLLVGMLYERRHTREFDQFGGIAHTMPVLCFFFIAVTLGSVGMPGLNGFVGEFLCFIGTFHESKATAIVAASGLVLGAWYMLLAVRKIFFGYITVGANADLRDLDRREIAVMVPLLVMIVVMGIYPMPFLAKMESSIRVVIDGYLAAIGRA